MKIQGLKNLNITLLFSAPLNHLLISKDDVVALFKTGDAQKDLFNLIEAPGLKVVIFPNQKKDIAFETSRISLNDKSEVEIEKSTIISDFRKVLGHRIFTDQSKIVAYGFNYDLLVELEHGDDLIGEKIAQIPGITIKSAGINLSFEKDELAHTLTITPTGQEKVFLAHFNSHFSSTNVPEDATLRAQMASQFKEFKEMMAGL